VLIPRIRTVPYARNAFRLRIVKLSSCFASATHTILSPAGLPFHASANLGESEKKGKITKNATYRRRDGLSRRVTGFLEP
jgi:hypothetical protein